MFSRRAGRGCLAVLALALATSGCAFVSRVSDSAGPTAPNAPTASGTSGNPSLSSDGRFVAFQSTAPDLLAGDTNGVTDVFVRDRSSGAVEIASESSSGTIGSGDSSSARISPNGRFVVFQSDAANLVLGDTNGATDVFLRDRQAGTTVRVSVGASAAQTVGGDSFRPAVSADGRFVAFSSAATNLVSGDTNAATDVFVRDVQSGTTTRVSVAGASTAANDSSDFATISADGRYVAYQSEATNLVAGDTNGETDVFVRDRQAAATTRASVATAGTQTTGGGSIDAEVSGNGRYVVFNSEATNLVAGDTNDAYDVFVRDRQTSTTTRVSVTGASTQANNLSYEPAISADGRYVTFSSDATNLGAPSGAVYRRDRTSSTTLLISKSTAGVTGNQPSGSSAVSGDGNVVAFASSATNFTGYDHNNLADTFARVISTNTTEVVSRYLVVQGNDGAFDRPSFSLDGRYIAFATYADNLVPGFTSNATSVFVRDTVNGSIDPISVTPAGNLSNTEGSLDPSISSDGRYVAFWTFATDIVANDTNDVADVYVRDRQTGATTLVSGGRAGQSNGYSESPVISGDGRYIAFDSFASNLVTADTNGANDVFVRDRQTGATTIVTPSGNNNSLSPSMSSDGRYIAFESGATNLVSGDTNGSFDIFVRDTVLGTTTRVSVGAGGAQSAGASGDAQISGDGRYVTYRSSAANLVAGDTNGVDDVFVYDRQALTTTRVSVGGVATQADAASGGPSISADGRYIVFPSNATNLVSGDTNGERDVFVRDRQTGRTTRVSTDQNLAQANGSSASNELSFVRPPSISPDGRYVGFTTSATNIVTPDANDQNDLVIRANPVPTVSSVTPATVARGATATITVNGTYFLPGVSSVFGDGITVTSTNRVSESQVKFTISVASTAATGNRNVIVFLPGTGAGVFTGAAAQFTLKVT
jgi:Tol biopolymer transport system component